MPEPSQTSEAKAIERRSDFPSWSWVGWSGAVCWKLPENDCDPNNEMFFCFRDLHFKDSRPSARRRPKRGPIREAGRRCCRALFQRQRVPSPRSICDAWADECTSEYTCGLEEARNLVCPRLVLETIFFKGDTFQLVYDSEGRPATIKLMDYTLPWFDKPNTLHHCQGSQLNSATLYEDLRSETCRIALIYAHETRNAYGTREADGTRTRHMTRSASQFEFQALVLRKCVDTEKNATSSCWYERVGGIHHHMNPNSDLTRHSDSVDQKEDERFLAWLKELFRTPDYEQVEIR